MPWTQVPSTAAFGVIIADYKPTNLPLLLSHLRLCLGPRPVCGITDIVKRLWCFVPSLESHNFVRLSLSSLRMKFGELVEITEENGDWYRGRLNKRGSQFGIFPKNHVHLKPCRKKRDSSTREFVEPDEDAVAREITGVVLEWNGMLIQAFKNRQMAQFKQMIFMMEELIKMRRQILAETLPADHLAELKERATEQIDVGNRKLGLDMIPRNSRGEVITTADTTVMEMYRVHLEQAPKRALKQMQRRDSKLSLDERKALPHHLMLHHIAFTSNVGEDTDIYYRLYDKSEDQFVSESFIVRLSKYAQPHDVGTLSDLRCVFTEIVIKNPCQLYVVAYVYRRGEMDPGKAQQADAGSKKAAPAASLRRPVGCGVVSLSDFIINAEEDQDNELEMPLFRTDDDNFYSLHMFIIEDISGRFRPYDAQKGIIFRSRLLTGPISSVQKKNPLLFKRGTMIVPRVGFADVIDPAITRDDLYVTLCHAEFDKGEKKAGRNVEVSVKLISDTGNLLKNCISPGLGAPRPTVFKTAIYRHNNKPFWYETIKLEVPPHLYSKAHLKFTFKHCSSTENHAKKDQLFAFSFLKLSEEGVSGGSVIKDGEHRLPVFKYNARVEEKSGVTPAYLNPKKSEFQPSGTEFLAIETYSCSTVRTQDMALNDLLRWENKVDCLDQILHRVTYSNGTEVVKFLQKILDALFAILDEHRDKYGLKVFDALVHMCSELSSSKLNNFQRVLENYIQKQLKSKDAHTFLLKYIHEYVAQKSRRVQDEDMCRKTRKMMKALRYLFSLAYRSRRLSNRRRKTKDLEDKEFKATITEVFGAFNNLMKETKDALFPTQQLCIQHFSSALPGLESFFATPEISSFATNFLNAIQISNNPKVVLVKMKYVRSLVQDQLFDRTESRKTLLPSVLNRLERLMDTESQKHALDILGDIMTKLQAEDKEKSAPDILATARSMLQPLLKLVHDECHTKREQRGAAAHARRSEGGRQRRDGRALIRGMNRREHSTSDLPDASRFACLLGLLKLMDVNHYKGYVQDLGTKEREAFCRQILEIFEVFISEPVFPKDWLVMDMAKNDVVLDTIQGMTAILEEHFLKGDEFNFDIWDSFFALAAQYVCQPGLQVEKFSATKREKILENGDDRRYAMAKLIAKGWKAMDQAQHIRFIHTTRKPGDGTRPKLVRSIQGAALVASTQVRETLIPLFYWMIECEVAESMVKTPDRPNFDVMQRELVDELDTCVSSGAGDQNYRWLFQQRMKLLCQKSNLELIQTSGLTMVKSVIDLLQQLLALRDVPEGDAFNDRRAGCMYALLDYYRERGLHNMAMRYVHRLVDVHYQSNHFTEAGFALQVHVDHLKFTDRKLPSLTDEDSSGQSFQRFPEQTERERRAELIEILLECFDKGQTWENAIPYAQQLADEYENATFDYAKLAQMHERIAGFWNKIVNDKQRLIPQFFKVGYFGGHDTPFGYRNVTFVYRGNKQDHIRTFCDRIQRQFPKATILMKNTDPTEAMKASPDMSIMICKLTPEVDAKFIEDKFKGRPIPEAAKAFYENNHISTFTYSRPFRKGEKTGNESETLWTANYRLQSEIAMPSLLNRTVLPDHLIEKVELSPIENAIKAMKDKNEELKQSISEKDQNPSMSINPLTMQLNGVLDAAVMGGTENYRKAFFTKSYVDSNPENAAFVTELQKCLEDQLKILELGCLVHRKYCPDNLKPLQLRLEEQLKMMMEKAKTKVVEDDRPRLPSGSGKDKGGTAGEAQSATSRHSKANPKNPFAAKKAAAQAAAVPKQNSQNPFNDGDSGSDDDNEKLPAPPRDSILPPLPGLVNPPPAASSGSKGTPSNPLNPFAEADSEDSSDEDPTSPLPALPLPLPGSGSRPASRPSSPKISSSPKIPGSPKPVPARPSNLATGAAAPSLQPRASPPVPRSAKPSKKGTNPFQKGDNNPFKKGMS